MNKSDIFVSDIRRHTIAVSDDKIKFFFFGCWNQNRIATNDIIGRINVESKCTFGVVCGDNVYPEKTDDTKVARIEDIREGFDILKQFRGNVYIGLGNHEVDSTIKCQALFDEKTHANDNLIMLNNYYSIDIINTTTGTLLSKIIILDTNVLEENTCYGPATVDVENEMIQWLRSELSECGDVMPIIMGHYPLFYFKQNKTSLLHEFKFNYTMEKIHKELIEYVKPVYYLCADIHNYQYTMSSNITQHVAGTGGALQDKVIEVDLPFTLPPSMTETHYMFNIIKCTQKYGYVEIDIENNIVTGEFKESVVPVEIKEIKVKPKKSKVVVDI